MSEVFKPAFPHITFIFKQSRCQLKKLPPWSLAAKDVQKGVS